MKKKKNLDPMHILDAKYNSAKVRGSRLKKLRNLANLSRRSLCDKANVNINTFKGWEVGRYGGLTYMGAHKIIECLKQLGIQCTLDWLLNEIGAGPNFITDFDKAQQDKNKDQTTFISKNEKEQIATELLCFKKQSEDSIDFIIEDDGMAPHYAIGDYVAGVKYYGKNIDLLLNNDCIVQTIQGQTLLRRLRQGNQKREYHLQCTNIQTSVKTPLIYDVKLSSGALVLWHRRKNPLGG